MGRLGDRFYVDLDGVLVDWMGAASEVLGVNPKDWVPGKELHVSAGISKSEMWRRIDAVGADFWANLEPYPWAMDLWQAVSSVGEARICSTPSFHPSSAAGKVMWMHKFFGSDFRDYTLMKDKYVLANPRSVLIDDKDEHIQNFNREGGVGILFPQHWNSRARDAHRNIDIVYQQLEQLYPQIMLPEPELD
jgi:5'(3')-deoxyribonucleotidase